MRTSPLLLLILTLGLTACDNKPSGTPVKKQTAPLPVQENKAVSTKVDEPSVFLSPKEFRQRDMCVLLDAEAVKKAFGHSLKEDTKQYAKYRCNFAVQSIGLGGSVSVYGYKSVEEAKKKFAKTTRSFTPEEQKIEAQKQKEKMVGLSSTLLVSTDGGQTVKTVPSLGTKKNTLGKRSAPSKASPRKFMAPTTIKTIKEDVNLGAHEAMMTVHTMYKGKNSSHTFVHIQRGNLTAKVEFNVLTEEQKKTQVPLLIKDISARMSKL